MSRHDSLNGGKTKPLSKHARGVLEQIARGPIITKRGGGGGGINAGVVDRLTRGPEPLCEHVEVPSPFKNAKKVPMTGALAITEAGRREIALWSTR